MNRSHLVPLFLMLLAGAALGAAPVVGDVTVAQRFDGSGLVDIAYTLSDADGDSCCISVQASDDGGLTWHLPCRALEGDVGGHVAPGGPRGILWRFAEDNPDYQGDVFQVRVLASDVGVAFPSHSPARYATLHFGGSDWNNQAFIEEISRYDLVTVTAAELWSADGEASHFVERVKALNPDCRILGYASAKTVRTGWANYPPGSYPRTLWDESLPYWTYTTTGDTLMDWFDVVNVNILEPGCRDVIVDNFVAWQQTAVNKLDGIYWDYFNTTIWIPDFISCEGEPDMDGDGISQYSDDDEIAAFKQACEELVTGLRAKLGDSFIQVFNGKRAYSDLAFASLADGLIYELFPTLAYYSGARVREAFDPAVPNSLPNVQNWLRKTAGGPFILLENHNQYRYYDENHQIQDLLTGDQFRVMGLLLDGIYPIWNADGVLDMFWPENVFDLGEPLGPTVVDGDVYTRLFRYGDVRMVMGGGDWPDPFDYEIRVNGMLVQSFALPYHFP